MLLVAGCASNLLDIDARGVVLVEEREPLRHRDGRLLQRDRVARAALQNNLPFGTLRTCRRGN